MAPKQERNIRARKKGAHQELSGNTSLVHEPFARSFELFVGSDTKSVHCRKIVPTTWRAGQCKAGRTAGWQRHRASRGVGDDAHAVPGFGTRISRITLEDTVADCRCQP